MNDETTNRADKRAMAAIPVHLRAGHTAAKIMARSRRAAYHGAPAAFDARIAGLAILTLLSAAAAAPFDEAVSRWATSSALPFVRILAAYTDIGKSTFYLLAALFVMTWLSFRNWRRRHVSAKARFALAYAQAAFVFAAIAGSGILVNVLKFIFARARPRLLDDLGPYDFFSQFGIGYAFTSFPSGHATTMGALAAVLALWYPGLRWVTVPACMLGAASRVAAGAHFPSDVIVGFGLGFLFSVYFSRVLARRSTVFRFKGGNLMPKLQFSGAFWKKLRPG